MAIFTIIRFNFDETDNLPQLCHMDIRQKEAREYKALPLAYYHLCTDGWSNGKLFNNTAQFRFGMATIALVAVMFDAKIISFELMPNHVHIILYGTGETCLAVFQFIRHRIVTRLKEDGNLLPPYDYWFKLKPLPDKKALQQEIIYLARNPYEKEIAIPGCYPWGSSYLFFSRVADFVRGKLVRDMKDTEIRRVTGSRTPLPETWEIHPDLGVLPRSFVRTDIVCARFSSAKEYLTRLVKDYESAVHIAQELGEDIVLSREEMNDILYKKATEMFPGRLVKNLTQEERGRLAVVLEKQYHFTGQTLADLLYMPERTISQFLTSKDYGYRRR